LSQEPLTYTVPEAAALLRIHKITAYEAIKRGEIPAVKVGRRLLVPRKALEEMLAKVSPTAAVG
jgi:excisionase family DNA binding protein